MQAIAKIWRAARVSTFGFLADNQALAATEFAVIVPLMLVMFFGTVEFSSAVAIDRKVTLIARTLSDLTSQSSGSVTDSALQNAFTASISIVTPYDATPVKATISEIYISSANVATVQWSKAATITSGATQATLTASSRNAGDIVTTMIPSSLLVAQTYLILSEVSYLYTPSVGYVLKSGVTMSDVSYTRPRQVSCVTYNNVPSGCPTP
ncbi:MAG: TadE/TadG family type IV pilus assembly protein [Rudaea sp.]